LEYGHVTCAKGRSLNELNYRVGIAVKKMNELKKGDHVKKSWRSCWSQKSWELPEIKRLKELLESKKVEGAARTTENKTTLHW